MPRTIPYNDHRAFNDPSVWIPLFDLEIGDEVLHYTPNHEAVEVEIDSVQYTYEPFPLYLEELCEDGKGEVVTVKLIVGNVGGLLSEKVRVAGFVDGGAITYMRYSVEKAAVVYEEALEIIRCGPITRESVTFEIGAFNPFLIKLLQEKYLMDFCWNRYKGEGCFLASASGTWRTPAGFAAGSPDSCQHNMTDCKRHSNVLRMNSFPGIPGIGAAV